MSSSTPSTPIQVTNIEAGSFGLSGWMKILGNATGMLIVAAIACWLLYTIVSELRHDVRELQRKADENNQVLRDVHRELQEIRREGKGWFTEVTKAAKAAGDRGKVEAMGGHVREP